MAFQPGQLAGDYEVLDVLGKGGMGSVYRVRNVISNRIEAMKVLLEDLGSQPGIGDRFIAEIRTLARLDHPNIAKLHTAFKVNNQLVMVMEFVDGVDLADRAREGSIPIYKVVGYVQSVLSALAYAHSHDVVHRDIKPSNIMVTPQGTVKLMDFGIAKSSAEPLLTQPGTTLGSLQYMSPEQVRGTAVDARSDLYSVGVVLYELTAGRRPFQAESTYEILDAQLNAAPPPPITINPSLPNGLNEIILTALEKDPAKRFQNAEAFRKALDGVVAAGAPAQTRLITDTERFSQPLPVAAPPPQLSQATKPRGRSLWMAAGAVACLAVLAAALIAVPHFRKSSAASTPAAASSQAAFNVPPPHEAAVPLQSSQVSSDLSTPTPALIMPAPNTSARHARVKAAPPQDARAAQQPAPPPPDPGSVRQSAPPPPAPAGPSEQEMNEAGEALMKIQSRAEAVHQSLASLKQQQAAQGLGLRGDIVESEARMGSYIQMADRQLQGRNLDSAKKNMDRAEEELSKLEKFLGR